MRSKHDRPFLRALRPLALGLFVAFAATGVQADASGELRVGGQVAAVRDADAIADALEDRTVVIRVQDQSVRRSWRELGARIDRTRLRSLLARIDEGQSLRLPAPVLMEIGPVSEWLLGLKRDIDQPAISARIDAESGAVVPEQDGKAVDVWASIEAIRDALIAGEEAAVVVRTNGAHRSASDFEGMQLDTLLGEFDTPYNGSGDAAERTHNLRVAAEKVDGLVLFPGEEFDFNEVVGERSLAEGFRPAPVIAGGELVDGVGGGACQIAGTLHAAAFFAGLEITERNPHSRPSSYIKLGLDAAVSYPNLNFRFRNNRDTPVLVRLIVQGGKTTVRIYGDRQHHAVRFVRRIDEAIPYDERTIEDESLPTGVQVLSQRGVPGFLLTRDRIIEDVDTRVWTRERSEDRYPPTTQIWRVGTGGARPADYSAPAGDTHGEYTADEFTVMTQGAGIEGTTTVRRRGRFGEPGWTERSGMPPSTR